MVASFVLVVLSASCFLAGGFSDEIVYNSQIHKELLQVLETIRPNIETKINENKVFDMFVPLKFKTQVVAGTNYLVKVQVSTNMCIHVKVFQPLAYMSIPPKLLTVSSFLTLDSPLIATNGM